MPTDVPHSAPTPTAVDDCAELAHWLGIVRDAYARGAHVDVVAFGETDQSTTTCWASTCPVVDQKAEFLWWLAETVDDADAFFVPEDGQ